MDSLKEFQEKMPNGFDSIAVDITGFCNANCKYCPASTRYTPPQAEKHFMSSGQFEAILDKLLEYRFYTPSTSFHIYATGEPCLHPQINTMLKLLSKYGVVTTISTNASIVPEFDRDALVSVERFLISMPGFSQESYDRIHGFNFETVKANIVKLRSSVAELSGGRIPFDMSYHIYQFNEAEMVPARAFCREHNIRFAPNYAVMIDKDKCLDYATGKMGGAELKDISKDIFLGVLDRQIQDAPRNYCDFQNRFLSVTSHGDIRVCSGFTRAAEPRILIGNILSDDVDTILARKFHHPRCDQCIQAGLTLAKGYECKVYPDGYYDIMKENDFIMEHFHDEKMPGKLRLMKLVRQFEREGCPPSLKEAVLKCAEEENLQTDLRDITLGYTRFNLKTYQMLVG